jgi:DNA helicase-2/ATP-dependent DNA helicase PcrA
MMVEGAVAQDFADRFDHVLVDEYQDTNRLQASILLALKPNGRGLTVVGDDAQATVHVWSKGLSRELAPHGITVNC